MARRHVHVKKVTIEQQWAKQLKQEQDRALADAWMREHPGARVVIYAISFALVVFVFITVWFRVPSVNADIVSTSTPTVDTPASLLVITSSPTQIATVKPTAIATHRPIITAKAQPTPSVTPRPTPSPTQPPVCQAVNGNPWCYNFSPGKYITNPPGDFCRYFKCSANFGSGDPVGGYVVECKDRTFSQSGGEKGVCSLHGGEMRPLYAH